jgi:hypothetical protein
VLLATASLFVALSLAVAPGVSATSYTLTVYGDAGFSPTSTARVFGLWNVPDLTAYLYGNGSQGDCPSRWWRPNNPNTWYDCISSFKVTNATCHEGITWYYSPNYGSPLITVWGNVSYSTIPGGYNDDYYSFHAQYRVNC